MLRRNAFKLRQLVRNVVPVGLIGNKDMVDGCNFGVVIQAP